MTPQAQKLLLQQAQTWFAEVIMENHRSNTQKLANVDEFQINPFLHHYLAAFLTGEVTPQSLARVLILPRVLGTSINTSFGTAIQKFTTDVLRNVFGSTTDGIDIEFTDALTGRKTFAQVKLGPNTINKDDVESIHGHFRKALRLAKTNAAKMGEACFAVGVLYGDESVLSGHYNALRDKHRYEVYVGQDFWHRLTGAENFYQQLIATFADVAIKANSKNLLKDVEDQLAKHFAAAK